MVSKQSTVDFLLEQMAGAGAVSARKMFGEYGLYCDGKMFALVCDDRLFIKPTPEGREFLGAGIAEAPPYPGAKPCFVIDGEAWDDSEGLAKVARITTDALPGPRKKSGTKIRRR